MKQPIVRPAAAADIEEAFLWYEEQRPGLGERFLTTVTDALESILDNPQLYPVVHRQTRRALLRKCPYGLFYRVVRGDIVLIACMHASRDPRRWKKRD